MLLRAPGWQRRPSTFDIWLERARLGWQLNKAGKRQRAQQGALSHPFQPNQAPREKQSTRNFFWHFRLFTPVQAQPSRAAAAESSPRPPSPTATPRGLTCSPLTILKHRDNILLCNGASQSSNHIHKAQDRPRCGGRSTLILSMLLLTSSFWLKTHSRWVNGSHPRRKPKVNPFRQRM